MKPEPAGWFESPHGAFRANPLWRFDPKPPQSIAWNIPLYADCNARLAAAPDLLHVLRWVSQHEGECIGDHPNVLAAIRAAIAKATGVSTNDSDPKQQQGVE